MTQSQRPAAQVQRVVDAKIKEFTRRGASPAEASKHANNQVGSAPASIPTRAKPVPAPGKKSSF